MNNNDYIYSELCKIYDLCKSKHNIKVECLVETSNLFYKGTLVFDSQLVIPENSLILEKVSTFNDFNSPVKQYELSIISFNDILAFSYNVINSSNAK